MHPLLYCIPAPTENPFLPPFVEEDLDFWSSPFQLVTIHFITFALDEAIKSDIHSRENDTGINFGLCPGGTHAASCLISSSALS